MCLLVILGQDFNQIHPSFPRFQPALVSPRNEVRVRVDIFRFQVFLCSRLIALSLINDLEPRIV